MDCQFFKVCYFKYYSHLRNPFTVTYCLMFDQITEYGSQSKLTHEIGYHTSCDNSQQLLLCAFYVPPLFKSHHIQVSYLIFWMPSGGGCYCYPHCRDSNVEFHVAKQRLDSSPHLPLRLGSDSPFWCSLYSSFLFSGYKYGSFSSMKRTSHYPLPPSPVKCLWNRVACLQWPQLLLLPQ